MVIERVSQPGASPAPVNRTRAILRFAAIESAGAFALVIFLVGFFTLDWFPGQPTALLVGALVCFAFYVVFAMWASGLLAQVIADRSNARR